MIAAMHVAVASTLLFSVVFCGGVGAVRILLPPANVDLNAAQPSSPVFMNVSGCSGSLPVHRPPNPTSQAITVAAFFPLPELSIDTSDQSTSNATMRTPTNLHYLLPAAVIAVDELNRAMAGTGYHLQLDVRNSMGDRFVATEELISLFSEEETNDTRPAVAVLGPGRLDVTTSLSPLAHRFSLPQVSYANDTNIPVITPEEKRSDYPSLFFMVRDVYHVATTALRVMDYLGLTEQVGFVYDEDLIYTKTVEQLVEESGGDFILRIENTRIAVPGDAFVRLSPHDRGEALGRFMRSVRENQIRVIAGLVGERSACATVCEATSGTVPGEGFMFVFVGAYQESWWFDEASCPCKLRASDVESVLIVSSQVKNTLTDETFVLGKRLKDLKEEYTDSLSQWCPETEGTDPNTFFATTYDAMLTLGLAINDTLSALNASVHNVAMVDYNASVYQPLLNSLAGTNFTGASGQVTFSSVGERMGIDVVQQIQGGVLTLVGTFHSESETLDINDSMLSWPGSRGVPDLYPDDIQKTATTSILVITLLVTVTSNVVTIALLVLVIRHRKHRIFIASGQRLNYIVFAGAFMAFATIYIFVLFESSVGPKMPERLFTFFCIVRLYLIMMGFTFTFGTLFVRAWRIYRIFNNPFVAKRKYTDTYLMLIVGFLALVDIILVTVFVSVDSYGRQVLRADADYDTFTACVYLGCFSEQYFLIGTFILAIYKILQMLLFLFVVSLVRRGVIERKIYDDSQYLAIALYLSAIVFFVGLPLQVLLSVSFKIAESLFVNMSWVNFSTDVTVIVIYAPKLYQIMYKKVDVRKLMSQKSKFYLYSAESRGSIL